jgi:hypothetical protein
MISLVIVKATPSENAVEPGGDSVGPFAASVPALLNENRGNPTSNFLRLAQVQGERRRTALLLYRTVGQNITVRWLEWPLITRLATIVRLLWPVRILRTGSYVAIS